jgi:hypothetical protein
MPRKLASTLAPGGGSMSSWVAARAPASPKSVTFATQSSPTMMFSGFTS